MIRKVNIWNRTFKRREGTEVCIWGDIILWVYNINGNFIDGLQMQMAKMIFEPEYCYQMTQDRV